MTDTAQDEIYLGNVGVRLIALVEDRLSPFSIADASTKEITFKKPVSGDLVVKPAVLFTDGKDGKMYYQTEAGFLDEVGVWQMQGYVETPAFTGKTSWTSFRVKANLS